MKQENFLAEERMKRLNKNRLNDIDKEIAKLNEQTVEVNDGESVFASIDDPIEVADHKTILRVLNSTKEQLKDIPLASSEQINKLIIDSLNIPIESLPETVSEGKYSPIKTPKDNVTEIVNKYLKEYDMSPHNSDDESYNNIITNLPPLE